MTKPLRSADPTPKSVQFSHFGVLDDGQRSKGAAFTSIGVNLSLLLIILVLGAVVRNNPKMAKKLSEVYLPTQPPPPPPPPKMPPPPPPKNLPTPPRVEPKIKMPEPEKLPEIKPVEMPKPTPPVPVPAPPKAVTPPPAPVKVNLGNKAASVVNNDARPSAISLGKSDSPIKTPTGPSVSSVNLAGAGAPGMKGAGNGPHATAVNMGSGSLNSNNINATGKGSQVVSGVKLGTLGSNGPRNSNNLSNSPVTVGMGNQQVQAAQRPTVVSTTAASPPKVVYKPTPVYTEEAKSIHLEGSVSIRIKVLASGTVQVLGVVQGLGHGLDQSAMQATQATRFKPAVDANGNAVDWEGVVKVNFQLS